MDSAVSESTSFALSEEHRALENRARAFVDEALIPYELECEFEGGLSEESVSAITQAVLDWGFNGVNHTKEDGGQGFDVFEQMLLNQQLGRATNAIWTVPHQPASAMKFATPEQKEEYLIPTNQMARRDAYVITEPGAGSDVRSVRTRADRVDGGFRINGEKWFTDGGGADYFLATGADVGVAERDAHLVLQAAGPGQLRLRNVLL